MGECIFEHTHTGVWKDTSDSLVFGEPVLLLTKSREGGGLAL